jgi:alpha-glucosidase
VHRSVSRYGLIRTAGAAETDVMGPALRPRGEINVRLGRARAALLNLLVLLGSICLFQGEELGLPEVLDLPYKARCDPI